jgi:hypothetical protein
LANKIIAFIKDYNVVPQTFLENLILKFSLILLVLDGSTGWGLDVFMRIICVIMLAFNNYIANKLLWLLISVFLIFFNSLQFYSIDNHKILFTYWILLITAYLWTGKNIEYIKNNARLMIGLVMFFAVLQKFLNGFHTPGFLHGRFLIDGRFMLVTNFITQTPYEELFDNQRDVTLLNYLPIDNSYINLTKSLYLSKVLYGFQLFGLVFEAIVAALFLFIKKENIIKDIALITFCIGTYFIFPVLGFSSILLLLGIGQSNVKTSKYYIIAFILLQFIMVPWQESIFYFKNSL